MANRAIRKYVAVPGLLAVALASLSACSSMPVPDQQIELTKNAVNRAVSADATEYAPVEMKNAQDKVFLMERAIGEKDYSKALELAQQAEVDANLAERKAMADKAQQTLKGARKGIEDLKQEMLQAPTSTPPTAQ